MWSFMKRQLKTKTGRLAATLIVGSVVNGVTNNAETAGTAAQVLNDVLTPEVGVFGAVAMLLRDRAAKVDNEER